MYAYLNADSEVVALCDQLLPFSEFDDSLGATSVLANAPNLLQHKTWAVYLGTFYHKYDPLLGDGTDISHYTEEATPVDPLELKISDYLLEPARLTEPPLYLNYRTGLAVRLERELVFHPTHKGYVSEKRFHPPENISIDPNTGAVIYSGNPVLTEFYQYTYDNAGYPVSRTMTPVYYMRNNQPHETSKVHKKTYTHPQRIEVMRRARQNAIDFVYTGVSALLIETELANTGMDYTATIDLGRSLLSDYSKEVSDYVDGAIPTLKDRLLAEGNYAWLDNTPASLGGATTIRQFILDSLELPSWA